MIRRHQDYILYQRSKKLRKSQKRKPIYYYQYRLPDGTLSNPRSTGCKSQTEAHRYVQSLIDNGTILCGSDLLFKSYASKFYDENGTWIKDKKALGTANKPGIGEIQIKKYQGFVNHYFVKYLPNNPLSSFTPSDIKEFRQNLLENEKLSRKTINDIMSCLRIMFTAAMDDGLVPKNPFRGIKPLLTEPKPRDAFSLEEVKQIVEYFKSEDLIRVYIIVAACTGMRLAEINSLRKSNIKNTYIDLKDQYRRGKLFPLKTRESRKIPICSELYNLLISTIPEGKEFVFDSLSDNRASDKLRGMLIKTMPEKRNEHGYCFHSLRHFANTYFLSKEIAPIKVASVMGHSTGVSSMQERYTNFTEKDFSEFYVVQSELFRYLTN
ncbi:MAG: site-specific integrase [Treponema sp.]|uniref:tyrosine-type recombinase/integrase n=1 Tax=Treponema sp. TaxID=166 RepID=UPI00298DBAD2|nr:tyrosine-type recombinase/integrase [Treponema sp.]MCQ2601276.1 site-specific integrase [Treponema sp.]